MLVVGVASLIRRPQNRFGLFLALAAIGWFLGEWNNPGIASPLAFAAGLVLYAVAPALVGHAALTYPTGRLSWWVDRAGVVLAYVGALVVLGLLPAASFDPAAAGCAQCPENLLLVDGSSAGFEDFNRIGLALGLAWSAGLVALLAVRLIRSSEALRRLVWPVILAAGTFVALVGVDFAHALDRGFLSNDQIDVDLRLAEAFALIALSLGLAWDWVRARLTRSTVAKLVVELAHSPQPGGLRDALAETLGDPSIRLAYPLSDGRLVGASGESVELEGQVSTLARRGRVVAVLSHKSGLLDDPGLSEEVAAAAGLGLENERLRAEARARLGDLRASRARVVVAGDAERRRLERDLHDGAQQRLVGLTLSLRVARADLEADPAPRGRLDEADTELRAALGELRELARGIFPTALADEGLAAALEAFAEEGSVPIELGEVAEARFGPAVEAAAYFVVSEIARSGSVNGLRVAATRRGGNLVVEIEADGSPSELTEIEDRIGALDGTLRVAQVPGGVVTVKAEIPCES